MHRAVAFTALLLSVGACAPPAASYPPPAPVAATAAAAATMIPIPASLSDRRQVMVAAIRADVLKMAPRFDAAALDRVLAVIRDLPREAFVARGARMLAYVDVPLSIGYGQTISDPYIVAVMTAAVRPPIGGTALDIGTGSGYQAAVLSPLSRRVVSIEIVPQLARSAARRLRRLGYRNIDVRAGDGFAGSPVDAPFDTIIVAAGAAAVPRPLLDQVRIGGRLVMPIGPGVFQEQLVVMTRRTDGGFDRCSLGPASFVPLTGAGRTAAGLRGLYDRSIPLCYGVPITG